MLLLPPRHPGFESRLRSYFGTALTVAHLKMAETPEGDTELLDYLLDSGEESKFPVIRCHGNIYVLPGAGDQQSAGLLRTAVSSVAVPAAN
jgi:hypothetical protein